MGFWSWWFWWDFKLTYALALCLMVYAVLHKFNVLCEGGLRCRLLPVKVGVRLLLLVYLMVVRCGLWDGVVLGELFSGLGWYCFCLVFIFVLDLSARGDSCFWALRVYCLSV